mgnify:CR=1 FL=1
MAAPRPLPEQTQYVACDQYLWSIRDVIEQLFVVLWLMRGAHEAQLQLDAITRSHVHTFYLHIFLCVNISALSPALGSKPKHGPHCSGLWDFLELLVILGLDTMSDLRMNQDNWIEANPGNVCWIYLFCLNPQLKILDVVIQIDSVTPSCLTANTN